MAESVTIANAALSHLGSTLISALADSTKEARYCNERIGKIRKALLRMHPWNFATKRKHLTLTYTTITGAANNGAGLIRITATAHGLTTGDRVNIDQIVGTSEANTQWYVTVITANTFDLQSSTFQNTYTSGGRVILIPQFDWGYQHSVPTDLLRIISVDGGDTDYKIEGGKILTDADAIDLEYIYDCSDSSLFDQLFAEAFGLYLAWDICTVLTQSDAKRTQLMKELQLILGKARFVDATEDPARVLQANDIVEAHVDFASQYVRDPRTS